jgi:Protein of unknown function (DUF3352)
MHRLVIALTTLLVLIGGTVVGGYLLFFSASTDHAAAVVPADTPIYINVYLQPSSAQQMNLGGLLGRLPGFADHATLDSKVDEAVQQLLGGSGVDYRRDLKPWLGDQLAIGVTPTGTNPDDVKTLLVAAVKDRPAADAALSRLTEQEGSAPTQATYQGITMISGATETHAFLDDGELLVLANDADGVRAAVDASSGGRPALASDSAFRAAMRDLPSDHLASAYLDLDGLADATVGSASLSGYSAASLALIAEHDGLHLVGQAPFDQSSAGASARAGFALSSEPSSLSDWMPDGTQAEAVIFGLRQLIETAESQIGQQPGTEQVGQSIAQLRAVIAFGLGLNVDEDVLPLLDRETALAITGFQAGAPHGQLLLRPSDAAAAASALERIRDALQQRGAQVSSSQLEGVDITTLDVPNTASVAYAIDDGVVIIGLSADDVAMALRTHASGASLGASAGYQKTFVIAGGRGGNELYVDLPAALEALGATAELPADTRDILQHVTGIGVTLPARQDRIEFHAVVTIE